MRSIPEPSTTPNKHDRQHERQHSVSFLLLSYTPPKANPKRKIFRAVPIPNRCHPPPPHRAWEQRTQAFRLSYQQPQQRRLTHRKGPDYYSGGRTQGTRPDATVTVSAAVLSCHSNGHQRPSLLTYVINNRVQQDLGDQVTPVEHENAILLGTFIVQERRRRPRRRGSSSRIRAWRGPPRRGCRGGRG